MGWNHQLVKTFQLCVFHYSPSISHTQFAYVFAINDLMDMLADSMVPYGMCAMSCSDTCAYDYLCIRVSM